jgi:8-oxo-dGTP pyrophosphatase MutT (NUDIX family)
MTLTRTGVAQRLSTRLLEPGAAMALDVRGGTDAAVLVALYVQDERLHIVFTRRRDDMRRHPGEVSFPGGRAEPGDRDLLETALRETDEEIGLPAQDVEVIGALQPTPTIATGYGVYPFVGLIDPGRAWTLSPREVARVLELPVDALRAGYARRRLLRRGLPIRTDTYVVGDELIWGATARILDDLLQRLGAIA